jgi:hypothetical protein
MRPALWKAALAGLVLFILGVAAGAATIDMLNEEEAATVTRREASTIVETRPTTVTRTRTVSEDGPGEVIRPGWSLCTNNRRGYTIGYPSGWYTTHLRASQACEYFDPRPFEIIPGTEFPPTALFAAQTEESVDTYVEQLTDPMFFETVRREDTTVAGRRAVLVETTATGEGESEPGERRYGYVVDRDGRAFVVLATGLPGDARYDDFKAVVDEAVQTVRFF